MTHVPSAQGFRYCTRKYGLSTGLRDLGYRLLRKVTAFNVHQVIAVNCRDYDRHHDRVNLCRFLTGEELQQFSKYPVYDLDSAMHQRFLAGQDLCYAMLMNGIPVSYSWFALNSVEAIHSAGLAASFPTNVAYFYKTYTLPDYRGQGLSQTVLTSAIETFKFRKYDSIFGIVEVNNRPSRNSCAQIGFQDIATLLAAFGSHPSVISGAQRLNDMGISVGENAKVKSRQELDKK